MMPLMGNGACRGNFSDIDAIMALKTERIIKSTGKEHFKIKELNIEFNIGNASLQLEVG